MFRIVFRQFEFSILYTYVSIYPTNLSLYVEVDPILLSVVVLVADVVRGRRCLLCLVVSRVVAVPDLFTGFA